MIAFWKKTAAALLCLLIAGSVLASCGEVTEENEKTGEFAVAKETLFLKIDGG